jgi:hypothetical protein
MIQWWPNFWPAVALGCLPLAYVAWLWWAERRGYVHFVPLAGARSVVEGPPLPPLRKQEWVPVRASGGFTVEGAEGYFVDLDADFETVGTREHIVLARLHPSRFLLLGRWPKYQVGWWYMFFMPAMLREVQPGHLHAGRDQQLALRIAYAPDEEKQHTLYLTFDDPQALRRVWDDLLRDAPPQVTG